MEDLSRRTFLRGALLAGAGAVGAGALTACAPQTTESKSAGCRILACNRGIAAFEPVLCR